MAEGEEPLINRICAKIEDFMFGDTENGGEAIFNNFVPKPNLNRLITKDFLVRFQSIPEIDAIRMSFNDMT